MAGMIGRKLGMTRVFSESGDSIPVTVIQAGPCYVTAIRTKENNGYESVQLGYEEVPERKLNKPRLGVFKKLNLKPLRYLKEFRNFDNIAELEPGQEIKVDIFQVGDRVKVTGISKGKGFQGVVKRHGFGGGPKTHGQSDRWRAPGSVGQASYPSRVFKGLRMAGRTGNDRVTVRNLEVVRVDVENHILMVKGAVPGARNGLVYITK
ncbi:MAG: 50S ribosomal protein L3 [candidate division KSB1 bacterium]|nr:50S ribosomal protein L3 [candidate division KSB1 bacterium]MDQ7063784.1 50S ribosomal protein L3 [candidate division KSB1 bacterium]